MNLREYKDKYGWPSVDELAKRSGTSLGYLKHVVAGRRRPSVDMAIVLAEKSGGKIKWTELLRDEAQ